jgi:hypothetical protein
MEQYLICIVLELQRLLIALQIMIYTLIRNHSKLPQIKTMVDLSQLTSLHYVLTITKNKLVLLAVTTIQNSNSIV